jgi:segregation and condensation protein A
MSFRVDLQIFRGPLDLLLYLVRKHEVDVVDIPIALITEQYLAHVAVLEHLDIDAVGDFIEMATVLVEIKSRLVLPRGTEGEEVIDEARDDLVRRLLEYKQFKDAASMLQERGREWQERFPRLANDLPPHKRNLAEEPIHEVELWDLVSAFGRILRENQAARPSSIVYDETPIHVYMERISERLVAERRLAFSGLLIPGMHKSTLTGLFLAVLELIRHHGVRAEQHGLFSEIWLYPVTPGDSTSGEHDGPEAEPAD